MALIKSCLASSGAGAPAMAFGVLGNNIFDSSFATGVDSITASNLPTASTMVLSVATGGLTTLTLTGLSSQYTTFNCYGVKADGTNVALTKSDNVVDVTDCVLVVATFFTQATFSASLS